jgi:hypothetical protein
MRIFVHGPYLWLAAYVAKQTEGGEGAISTAMLQETLLF